MRTDSTMSTDPFAPADPFAAAPFAAAPFAAAPFAAAPFATVSLATAPPGKMSFPTVDQLPVIDMIGADPEHAITIDRAAKRAREEAHTAGYSDGYTEGVDAARAEVRSEIVHAVSALHAAAAELSERDAVGLASMTTAAIELAVSIAEAVLQREVTTSVLAGRQALARALSVAPNRGEVDAHLHPSDIDAVGDIAELAPGRDVRLVPDASVERGGCVLHVGAARIDAQLGTALARVRAELMGTDSVGTELMGDAALAGELTGGDGR